MIDPEIQSVDVSYDEVRPAAVESILALVRSATQLKKLNINGNILSQVILVMFSMHRDVLMLKQQREVDSIGAVMEGKGWSIEDVLGEVEDLEDPEVWMSLHIICFNQILSLGL